MKLRRLNWIWLVMVPICLFPNNLFPADLFVTTTVDTGLGSFRDAIKQSAISAEPDIILFQIPKADPGYSANTGVWTIMASSHYVITDSNLVINGMSQSEFIGEDTNPSGPEIEFKGSVAIGNNGIFIISSGVHIYYLTINEFGGAGIYLDGAINCHITGCYIGTDPTGMEAKGNIYGIYVDGSKSNHIVPMDTLPNVISGNPWVGITLGFGSSNNVIIGNIIGMNRTKSDTIGNGLIGGYGGVNISDKSHHNEVYDNWIMGNKVGVNITESSYNMIAHNFIGTNDDWHMSFGNTGNGITIWTFSDSATHNLIMDNVIGYNGWYGISVNGNMAVSNTLTRNSISGNGAMGIINYQGGNMELARPVIQSVSGSQVTGTAGPNMTIEIFEDDEDEGQSFLGATLSNESGYFTFLTGGHSPTNYVTATATDSVGNTSDFSSPVAAVTGVDGFSQLPVQFKLCQNFPNPFNPQTSISFELAKQERVKVLIINQVGQIIRHLVNEEMNAGKYFVMWDAKNDDWKNISSGIYFCQMIAGAYKQYIKMLYLK